MLKLSYLLEEYRQRINNDMLYAIVFKKLVKKYLQMDPLYRAQFKDVVTWEQFPYDDGNVNAIDLVARHLDGSYCAIQCQCNEVDYRFKRADLRSFLNSIRKDVYSGAMVFTTTNNDIGCVYNATKEAGKPVSVVGISNLENSDIDWEVILKNIYISLNNYLMNNRDIDLYDFKNQSNKKRNSNRDTKLDRKIEMFSEAENGELTIPFRSHKDSLDVVDRIMPKKGKALFLLQSVKQLNDVLNEYKRRKRGSLQHLIVHIDEDSVLSDAKDDGTEVQAIAKVVEMENIFEDLPSKRVFETTSYEDLGKKIQATAKRYKNDDKGMLVFSNYNAVGAIRGAQKRGLSDFDLVVCNESESNRYDYYHDKNTPYTNSAYMLSQNNKAVRAKKRLNIKPQGHPNLRTGTKEEVPRRKGGRKLGRFVGWVSRLLHFRQ